MTWRRVDTAPAEQGRGKTLGRRKEKQQKLEKRRRNITFHVQWSSTYRERRESQQRGKSLLIVHVWERRKKRGKGKWG